MTKNKAQIAAEQSIGESMTECVLRLLHGVTLTKDQVDRIIRRLNQCLEQVK